MMRRMTPTRLLRTGAPLSICVLLAAGCGGSSGAASTPASTSSPAASSAPSRASTTGASGASGAPLAADANSAATGDIPDNQNFLTFTDAKAGFSMRYPEGWAQSGSVDRVAFRDKNNLVRVVVERGAAPTVASVSTEMARLKARSRTLRPNAPRALMIRGKRLVKVTYTTTSAPNPVTGKRVTLAVDRYELAHGGRVATVELGTPRGVDNIDAYRMMIGSFKWR